MFREEAVSKGTWRWQAKVQHPFRGCHFCLLPQTIYYLEFMAGTTGLEPATSAVTDELVAVTY
jgi:hypothetical protein